jgi:predicted permease
MQNRLAELGRRFLALFHRGQFDADLDEEMRLRQELREHEQVERGVSPEEAHYAAQRRFGNKLVLREESRDMRGWNWLETFLQDARYGLRQLRRNPGFTAIAVTTLALGIGANTAIFSLIDAALLRSLPVRDPQHLVVLKWTARQQPKLEGFNSFMDCPGDEPGEHGCSFSYPMFKQFRSLRNVFSAMAAIGGRTQLTLKDNGTSRNVVGELVSGEFFKALGVRAVIGRILEGSDDAPGAPPVVVLSDSYWQSAFDGNPAAVGRVIQLNRVPVTIVGVIADTFPGLRPGSSRQLWFPLSLQPELVAPDDWFGTQGGKKPSLRAGDAVWWLYPIARLNPGVSLRQAQAAANLSFHNDVLHGSRTFFEPGDAPRLVLMRAPEGLPGAKEGLYRPLVILMFAAGIVLLIACANVAGLTISRSTARQTEIAVRMALGAMPARVVRQLLTEGVLLAMAGGALGLLAAYWSARSLTLLMSGAGFWPSQFVVHLDARVLAFTAAVSMATAIVSGLAPAFRGTRFDLTSALKGKTGGFAGLMRRGAGAPPLGGAVLVGQVALSVLVLAGAGLLVRTLENLRSVSPGFDTEKVLLFGLDPSLQGYSDARCRSFYASLQNGLSGLPGVISVSYSYDELLSGNLWTASFRIEGPARRQRGETDGIAVGPKFTETMGIPLLAGRTLAVQDFEPKRSTQAVMINESFARQFFGNSNPLGQVVTGLARGGKKSEIVGVVGDAKYQSLREAMQPTVYVPQTGGSAYFEVRTAGEPQALVPAVRNVVSRLNADIPIFDVRTERDLIKQALFQPGLMARLSSLFGMLALVMACIGLYGLVSYEAVQRTHEIGIRMALGARKRDVLRLVLGQGMALAMIGVGMGIAGALGLTRFLSSLLYGVKPTNPLTFIVVSLVLIAVTLLACYIPARRAANVDPMVALRCE